MPTFQQQNDSMSVKKTTKPRAAQKRSASVAVSTSLKDRYAATILERLAAGETLRAICRTEGFPTHSAVLFWVSGDQLFSDQYARARSSGLEILADELVEIADETAHDTITTERGDDIPNSEWIARSRLRVDTRKWLLSKLRPDKYGDRLQQEISGPGGGPVQSKHEIVFVKPEGK